MIAGNSSVSVTTRPKFESIWCILSCLQYFGVVKLSTIPCEWGKCQGLLAGLTRVSNYQRFLFHLLQLVTCR